ncbi:MAG TPA: hypothetical protein VNO22_05310 [Planctomycetota bacterium]|nr:hypothetical protein [Planctomycetota bacterium]
MRRTAAALLAALAACAGLAPLDPESARALAALPVPEGPFVRAKVRLEFESPAFSGRFEGVVLARPGPEPAVRAQFFPDVGGTAVDLAARPDRVAGRFPPTGEAILMNLPGEARPHPLALLGATLLERFAPATAERARGVRRENGETWVALEGAARGVRVEVLLPGGARRRFSWMPGVRWEERSTPGRSIEIEAPRLRARGEVLEIDRRREVPEGVFDWTPGGRP